MFGICLMPKKSIAAATATTMNRNLRLVATIDRIMAGARLPASLFLELELGPEQLLRSDRHHRGAGWRTRRQNRPVSLDIVDLDASADEGQRLGVGVRPGLALGVVQDRCVG